MIVRCVLSVPDSKCVQYRYVIVSVCTSFILCFGVHYLLGLGGIPWVFTGFCHKMMSSFSDITKVDESDGWLSGLRVVLETMGRSDSSE